MSKLTQKFSMVLGATVKVTLALFLVIFGASVSLAQNKAYLALLGSNAVAVIDTSTNTVVATVPVGSQPTTAKVTPDGAFAYVTNRASNNVSVIDTSTNTVTATVPVGARPTNIIITPNGAFVYVGTKVSSSISVIATATNTVVTTITGVPTPISLSITPNGASFTCRLFSTASR